MEKQIKEFKRIERNLQQPVQINSITEYINIMERYKEYLLMFNKIGHEIAAKLCSGYEEHPTLDEILIELYFDEINNKIVFKNKCYFNFFFNFHDFFINNRGMDLDDITKLMFNKNFMEIVSEFETPVSISQKVKGQIYNCESPHFEHCYIDDLLEELRSIRAGKVERLLADL